MEVLLPLLAVPFVGVVLLAGRFRGWCASAPSGVPAGGFVAVGPEGVAPPPGPAPRAAWDRPVPQPPDRAWWCGATFHPLPPAGHFAGRSPTNPVVVPGLRPHQGSQPLSARERAWVREPVLRPVLLVGLEGSDTNDPINLGKKLTLVCGHASVAGNSSVAWTLKSLFLFWNLMFYVFIVPLSV